MQQEHSEKHSATGRILYRTFSLYWFSIFLIGRFILLFFIVNAILHFTENPIAIIVVTLLLFLAFIAIGTDQLVVYEKCFELSDDSILSLLKKRNRYFFRDIESVNLDSVDMASG